jgi:hypothetical protein
MEAFSIAAALATAVQGRALIVLHLLPTGHNPVRDAVSDYGVGPHQTLNDRAQEFPRVDDRVISRPHQYGYSAMSGEVRRSRHGRQGRCQGPPPQATAAAAGDHPRSPAHTKNGEI